LRALICIKYCSIFNSGNFKTWEINLKVLKNFSMNNRLVRQLGF
jgi:hypothetical protein